MEWLVVSSLLVLWIVVVALILRLTALEREVDRLKFRSKVGGRY